MQIELTRTDNKSHRLKITRSDGTSEERILETRSLLLHDLVHLAFESETRIDFGFWGSLAGGATMASLYDPAPAANARLAEVESLVVPLQSLWHGRMSREQYLEHAASVPAIPVDAVLLDAVLEKMRRLWGEWQALLFGETMEIKWDDTGK